ncbi:hypothetical protein LI221_10035 [Faecalimonas umbilicata]|nr:hypothetical protein [Faecalimonas umbilicata]
MKRINKEVKGVILLAAVMTEVAACGMTQKEYETQALTMLEEKYGEEFAVQEYCGMEFLDGYFTVKCYPRENPDVIFEAKTACDGGYIQDEYVAALVCRKAEQRIDDNLAHLEGYLLEKALPVSREVDSVDTNMSVEEFMELKSKNRFAVYLMYCPQERNIEKVYAELQKTFYGLECMSGNIQLYIMQEEELREMQEYFAETAEFGREFGEMTEKTERITIPFKNGTIMMSEEDFKAKARGLI